MNHFIYDFFMALFTPGINGFSIDCFIGAVLKPYTVRPFVQQTAHPERQLCLSTKIICVTSNNAFRCLTDEPNMRNSLRSFPAVI